MRLIDADAFAMTATCPKEMDIDSFIEGMGVVLDRIYEAPAVDAVQVVRCKECVYHRRCMLQHFVESNVVDSTKIDWNKWYCADGERREG